EDSRRDPLVTGVQTCALPISTPILALIPRIQLAQSARPRPPPGCNGLFKLVGIRLNRGLCDERLRSKIGRTLIWLLRHPQVQQRSEEGRVGKRGGNMRELR